MKIVQFLHGNQLGGMEKFSIDLANALSKEHEVLFLGDRVFKKYVDNSVTFVALDTKKSRNNIVFLWKLWKLWKNFSPDIIHVHKQKSIQIMQRLTYFMNIPYIATKHDIQIKKAFYRLKYAISISEETKKSIKSEYLYKIYNGIPYKKPQKISLPDTFNIVAVGGLRMVKGYDRLIQAVSTLEFDYHLTIIGEGSEKEALERLISKLNLEKNVSLIGFKFNVNDYLYSADLQVISSVSEGFSLAMVEGLFYSKVLISTKVGVGIEILSDELLVDIDEFSKKLAHVKHNYTKYQKEFDVIKQKYSEKLTIERCAKEHVRFFLEIINKEGKS